MARTVVVAHRTVCRAMGCGCLSTASVVRLALHRRDGVFRPGPAGDDAAVLTAGDLGRPLGVLRTPTVLLLGPDVDIRSGASGPMGRQPAEAAPADQLGAPTWTDRRPCRADRPSAFRP